MPVRVVEGVVQHYAWGDQSFIPEFLGVASRGQPWAELWLGTHPNGPAVLDDGTPLEDLCGPLPYLLKVLAAAEPLSLQAHPTAEQAIAGYELGVFPDPFPKPELLVAVTPFEALCGFRPYGSTIDWLRSLGVDDLADVVQERGADTLAALYRGELDLTSTIDHRLADSDDPQARWIHRLGETYGHSDPSVVASLLLNHVRLDPGQALHLTAGNLHAYLGGVGIELMGASDNVVRGGLTVKDVDVDLLLDIVDPSPLRQPVMRGTDGRYPLPEAGVALVRLEPGDSHRASGHELAVALDGTTVYLSPGTPIMAEAVTFVVTPI
jgi:mannose-6-phosphate isomerase